MRTGLVRAASAVVAAAALVGTVTGCGSDDGTGGTIRRVGSKYKTIQAAVDDAKPGDLVLISPGTYHEAVEVKTNGIVIRGIDRNQVILDGDDELTNGFEVRSDRVSIENLTVRRYALNGILFTGSYVTTDDDGGPRGWRASYVTAANNGLYGLYAFGTGPGVFDHNYASGHPDSGIYVGQCQRCGAVVIDNVMERNAIGYENTNASGVIVARNVARSNRIGMTIASGLQEKLAPQRGGDIVANLIIDNNQAQAPATEGGFATGLVIAGGISNRIERNVVTGHRSVGILLIDQDDFDPTSNRIRTNRLGTNRVDLAFVAESGDAPLAAGNCFDGNEGVGSATLTTNPPRLTELLRCGAQAGQVPASTLDALSAPGPFDYRLVKAPPNQPNRPGQADEWTPPKPRPTKPDLAKLVAPKR